MGGRIIYFERSRTRPAFVSTDTEKHLHNVNIACNPSRTLIPMDTTKKAFLTFGETAAVLNVSVPMVRKLIRRGHLNVDPLVRRHMRVPISSIEKYIKQAEAYVHYSALRGKCPM